MTALTARPLRLRSNRTEVAEGRHADAVLEKWSERTAALGTAYTIEGGAGHVTCDPGGIRGPEGLVEPPHRLIPPEIRLAPSDVLAPALPATATAVNVHWANGISLLGYEFLLDKLPMPIAGQVVTLYWMTDRPVSGDIDIRIVATRGERERLVIDHIPGDWNLPVDQWVPGTVVRDETLFRLDWEPGGTVSFHAGLLDRRPLIPDRSDQELTEDAFIHVGDATYEKGAPPFHEVLGPRIAERARIESGLTEK